MADEKVTVDVEPQPRSQDDEGAEHRPTRGAPIKKEPKDNNTLGLDQLVQYLQIPFLLVLLVICVALRFRGDHSIADIVLAFVGAFVMLVFFIIVRPPNYLDDDILLPCKQLDRFWTALTLSFLFPALFAANLLVAFEAHYSSADPFMKYQIGLMLIPFGLVLLMLANKWRLLRAAKEGPVFRVEDLGREINRTRLLLHTSLFCFMLGLMVAVAFIRWKDADDSDDDVELYRGKILIALEGVLLVFFWFNLAWQNMGDKNKCFLFCVEVLCLYPCRNSNQRNLQACAPQNKTVAILAGLTYSAVLMADIIWSVSRSDDKTVGLTALELVPLLIVVVYLLWCPPNRKSVVRDITHHFRETDDPSTAHVQPNP